MQIRVVYGEDRNRISLLRCNLDTKAQFRGIGNKNARLWMLFEDHRSDILHRLCIWGWLENYCCRKYPLFLILPCKILIRYNFCPWVGNTHSLKWCEFCPFRRGIREPIGAASRTKQRRFQTFPVPRQLDRFWCRLRYSLQRGWGSFKFWFLRSTMIWYFELMQFSRYSDSD